MPLPEVIHDDHCSLARRWILDPSLAQDLVALEGLAQTRFTAPGIHWPGLWIISGFRTREHQAWLNPDAPDSCHLPCPSLAADLRVGTVDGLDAPEVWTILGGFWELELLGRWGGRFSPPDMNHFDHGPCL